MKNYILAKMVNSLKIFYIIIHSGKFDLNYINYIIQTLPSYSKNNENIRLKTFSMKKVNSG